MNEVEEVEYIECDCCEGNREHELNCTSVICDKCDGNGEVCIECEVYHDEDEGCDD